MADLKVDVVGDLDGARLLATDWAGLHRQAASANPFTHPAWLIPWAEEFHAPGEIRILTVRDAGVLVAVAPLYVQHLPLGTRVLRALGTGRAAATVELPGVLTDPATSRQALRAIVGWVVQHADDWNWLELPLNPCQGWVEPAWLNRASGQAGTALHKGVRACVVLPLPALGTALESGLKRNVRESLRRSRNRLDRSGKSWSIEVFDGANAVDGLADLLRLHADRAQMRDKPKHPSHFDGTAERRFLEAAVRGAGIDPGVEILVLRVDQRAVAARMVLRAPQAIYLGWSGLDPDYWEFSAVTLLTGEAIRRAIARGDVTANLSTGPDTSKLRWSDRLEVHNEFLIPSAGRRNRWRFSAYLAASSVAAFRRERLLREVSGLPG